MTHKIKFSPDFIDAYEGTAEDLSNIIGKLTAILNSGEDLENFASSIVYGVNSFDKIISITL